MSAPKVEIDRREYERLASAGLSHAQIAKQLHVGTGTLSRWKKRIGVSSYRRPQDYLELKRRGLLDKEINQRWGITPSALYQWKKRKGLIK